MQEILGLCGGDGERERRRKKNGKRRMCKCKAIDEFVVHTTSKAFMPDVKIFLHFCCCCYMVNV